MLALRIGRTDAIEESDQAGGKSTFTTQFGNLQARRTAEYALLCGALCWAIVARIAPHVLHPLAATAGIVAIAWHTRAALEISALATTNAFAEISAYKRSLHRAIWDGNLALVAAMVLLRLVGASTSP